LEEQDWRLLDNKIQHVFFNLSFRGYDQYTTKEVVNISSAKIKQFFQDLKRKKNKRIKMTQREQIEGLNKYSEYGYKLLGIIDNFKKQYSWVYEPKEY
jgi:ribosome-binding ATPase YchF (GTP1/OBG family)